MLPLPSARSHAAAPRIAAPVALAAALLAAAACSSSSSSSSQQQAAAGTEIKIAAASDLARAFPEVGKAFEAKTHHKVTFSFGSSGLLAKQIAEGAPFDLFAAANVDFVDDAIKAGRCDAASKAIYTRGHLVVWTRKGTPTATIPDLVDARFVKVAIANPEHAPYGRAAREALQHVGVWDSVKPKLVFGENVQQAMQFAQSGNADAAIVSLSLAEGSEGQYSPVNDSDYAPLDQALAACGDGPRLAVAKDFAAFVMSEQGREIMNRYGFVRAGQQVW